LLLPYQLQDFSQVKFDSDAIQQNNETDTSRTNHTLYKAVNEEDDMNTSTKAPDTEANYNDVFEDCMGS
jgi:hypothetical protein